MIKRILIISLASLPLLMYIGIVLDINLIKDYGLLKTAGFFLILGVFNEITHRLLDK